MDRDHFIDEKEVTPKFLYHETLKRAHGKISFSVNVAIMTWAVVNVLIFVTSYN